MITGERRAAFVCPCAGSRTNRKRATIIVRMCLLPLVVQDATGCYLETVETAEDKSEEFDEARPPGVACL